MNPHRRWIRVAAGAALAGLLAWLLKRAGSPPPVEQWDALRPVDERRAERVPD